VQEREADAVEIIATLVATAADPRELDAVVAALAKAPVVRHASWTARPSE
jgi:putative Mg2+ transporter-C (MgtC) family protein